MRKILVFNRLGIGDVVVTTPLAQLIKENFEAKVGFVVAAKSADILKNHDYIDDVFPYTKRTKGEVIAQIKAKGYEEAIIVDERFSSSLLAWKAGAKLLNVGKEISIGIKRIFIRKQHELRASEDFGSYIKLLNPAIDYRGIVPRIGNMDEARRDYVNAWLKKILAMSSKLVLIVPRSAADNKNWPRESFAEVNRYLNQHGIVPVYIGAPADKEYIEQIGSSKYNAAGELSLRELPVIAQQAAFAISVCTGPLHIIGTANIPILAIYGQGEPKRWAPASAIVVQSKLPCVPCLRLDCSQPQGQTCMEEISPSRLIQIMETNKLLQ